MSTQKAVAPVAPIALNLLARFVESISQIHFHPPFRWQFFLSFYWSVEELVYTELWRALAAKFTGTMGTSARQLPLLQKISSLDAMVVRNNVFFWEIHFFKNNFIGNG